MEHLFIPDKEPARILNTSEIKEIVLDRNKKQTIYNQDMFGPIKEDTVILVIFVQKSTINLKFMIMSLSQVTGIQETLIVFSHSRYDEHFDNLIKAIDFCRVMQIYFPYSLQLYPSEFPGFTPGDCVPDQSLSVAEYLHCNGASNPDMHGRFRNPQDAEKKHYWWWTANHVFENLKIIDNHNGVVIFIEHDYIFIDDFLYMTLLMKKISSTIPGCELLALAATEPSDDHATVDVMSWDPALHSGVLAFDLSTWNSIVSHYDLFCDIDDYSWAESLSYLSLNRIDGDKYRVMSSKFPRAYKTDKCIVFGSFAECDVQAGVHQIYNLRDQVSSHLFPTYIEVFVDIEFEDQYTSFDYVDVNGGWNDPRDKALCRNLTVFKIKKEILQMHHQFDGILE
ncbi:alpha-1,6-mannosyl-glycoprotein 2-beta-N-acetylglucosaminyltransferase-like [Leguminivora glycinivorella]|uniref:alpha-1,6-mannosyl-glycoprotein 2-beta-N-acetylglucosaminyltransferase-like n=1 Tax=Leguminivora glycinivorella TaxID=1035111 RepID=UPI00200D8530|nr:alpha-1,6-mannosyl-glycoprotein 2-beta-N-acetylglucosaminyltransferase-like [Leguminivora glycinivorella]